jgi:hypothetical protein
VRALIRRQTYFIGVTAVDGVDKQVFGWLREACDAAD